MPEAFRPLVELEAEVPGSWYVNVVAVHQEHRGQGFGGRLLTHAEDVARATGARQMSIIFESGNEGGARLYQRLGYAEKAKRAACPIRATIRVRGVAADGQGPGRSGERLGQSDSRRRGNDEVHENGR